MSKSNLLLELYSNLSTTGALTFSSKALVQKMVSQVKLQDAKVVVELGGGDGSITKGIVSKLPSDARLLVFEINESFCESMRKDFPQENVEIINDSAENLDQYLQGQRIDFIFCSLPFTLISKEVTQIILSKCSQYLAQTGFFVAISYSYALKSQFKKHFNKVNVEFTLKNLPPAFVWLCQSL
ncbi:class I SAM-dependent methyltransferase [Algoriphagus namhaensis]